MRTTRRDAQEFRVRPFECRDVMKTLKIGTLEPATFTATYSEVL